MDILIRPATALDVPALHALIERAYRGDEARRGWTHEADLLGGQRTDAAALQEMLASPDHSMLVASASEALVGSVNVMRTDAQLCYLGLLTVEPSLQTAGIGRRLIAAAEHEAATRFSARRMEMNVIRQRSELISYYLRRGYALTGEERPFPLDNPRFGIPRTRDLAFVVLEKPLPGERPG